MLDLTSYNIDVDKPLTQREFEERIEKGIIKSGDTVVVYDNWNYPRKTQYIVIPPPQIDEKS